MTIIVRAISAAHKQKLPVTAYTQRSRRKLAQTSIDQLRDVSKLACDLRSCICSDDLRVIVDLRHLEDIAVYVRKLQGQAAPQSARKHRFLYAPESGAKIEAICGIDFDSSASSDHNNRGEPTQIQYEVECTCLSRCEGCESQI